LRVAGAVADILPFANVSTTFADGKYGGKKKALEAAQKFRDVQCAYLPESEQFRISRVRKKIGKRKAKGGK